MVFLTMKKEGLLKKTCLITCLEHLNTVILMSDSQDILTLAVLQFSLSLESLL